MNIAEMEALVRAILNEPGQSKITSEEIRNALNDGYKDVASKALCVEDETLFAINAGQKVYLPDYLKIMFVRVDTKITKVYKTIKLAISDISSVVSVSSAKIEEPPVSEGLPLTITGMPTISISTAVV